jgi:hypothetical protein
MVLADSQLTWAPVRLSMDKVEFNTSSLEAGVRMQGTFKTAMKDSLTRIQRDCSLIGIVNQGSFWLLEAEFQARGIAMEYLCNSIPGWIAHVEKYKVTREFSSHQFSPSC